jgi:riboflavin kinase/FMN adenylyltransferase
MLGRPVSVLGTVAKGSRRGRYLGFPTANIDPHHEAIPPAGVYAVRVKIDKSSRFYGGVLNIGFRPTFHGKPEPGAEPTIEVHVLGFKKKVLYGRTVEVEFIKRIRPERHFRHPEALRRQIRKDVAITRKLLK